MPTPAELRESLPRRMAAICLSSRDICKIAEWSESQLSGFLSGKRHVHIDDVQQLNAAMTELEHVAEVCSPIPVDFRNKELVLALVKKINEGHFRLNDETTNYARMKIILTVLQEAHD
jgi:hypothetical protein